MLVGFLGRLQSGKTAECQVTPPIDGSSMANPGLGVVLGVATALCYASYLLLIRRGGRDLRRPAGPVAIATVSTAAVAVVVGWIGGDLDLTPAPASLAWLALLGLTSQALGYLLISLSLTRLPAVLTSIILLAQLDHKPAAARFVELLQFDRPEVFVAAAWGLRKLDVPETLPGVASYVKSRAQQLLSGQPSMGYPGDKYQAGLELLDVVEVTVSAAVADVMSARFAEIRPTSATLANLAVYTALASAGGLLGGAQSVPDRWGAPDDSESQLMNARGPDLGVTSAGTSTSSQRI